MLRGKTALVTGGGGGIGREIAARLKAAGANVAICGRNVEKLEAAAHAIGGALTLPGDLLDDTYVQSCVDRTVETFGGLDILINNAGVALSKPFAETAIEDFDRVMATNVRAPFILIRSALPQLRKARGRVINIASVVAHKGYPLQKRLCRLQARPARPFQVAGQRTLRRWRARACHQPRRRLHGHG